MDYQFERDWLDTLKKIQERFGMGQPDITAIIFLVGLQELQLFEHNFKKDQKVKTNKLSIKKNFL